MTDEKTKIFQAMWPGICNHVSACLSSYTFRVVNWLKGLTVLCFFPSSGFKPLAFHIPSPRNSKACSCAYPSDALRTWGCIKKQSSSLWTPNSLIDHKLLGAENMLFVYSHIIAPGS